MKFLIEIPDPPEDIDYEYAQTFFANLIKTMLAEAAHPLTVTIVPPEPKPPTEAESQAALNALRRKLTSSSGDINSPELSMFRQYQVTDDNTEGLEDQNVWH